MEFLTQISVTLRRALASLGTCSANGRTSVRGGYGIFYNAINADSVAQINAPYAGTTQVALGDVGNPFTSVGETNPPVTLTGQFGCVKIPTYPAIAALFFLSRSAVYTQELILDRLCIRNSICQFRGKLLQARWSRSLFVGNHGGRIPGYVTNNPAIFKPDPLREISPFRGECQRSRAV